jgi:hypothetical protein
VEKTANSLPVNAIPGIVPVLRRELASVVSWKVHCYTADFVGELRSNPVKVRCQAGVGAWKRR